MFTHRRCRQDQKAGEHEKRDKAHIATEIVFSLKAAEVFFTSMARKMKPAGPSREGQSEAECKKHTAHSYYSAFLAKARLSNKSVVFRTRLNTLRLFCVVVCLAL